MAVKQIVNADLDKHKTKGISDRSREVNKGKRNDRNRRTISST